MIYAQIKSGRKLHIAMQPGERDPSGRIVEAGNLSDPICGQPMKTAARYRMTINVPLGNACKKCRVVATKLSSRDGK